MSEIESKVKEYYGKTLSSGADLKTNACCTLTAYPEKIKKILAQIHPEVLAKYYGCGLTIPFDLEGLKVVDLGCGAGRDVFLLSKLVGESGQVIGIDMTEEQLAVANQTKDYHREQFGHKQSNTEFIQANIEQIDRLSIAENSQDLVVSNCVINLVENKPKVLSDVYRLLKEGGEFYFSDVYVNRRVPEELKKDDVLYGECLSGALYWNDFIQMAKRAGFTDPRLVESEPIVIEDPRIKNQLGGMNFYSATYRLFKLPELEMDCEDYGQMVRYRGGIVDQGHGHRLDEHHYFEKNKWESVCGNTFRMLKQTRFEKYYDFEGSFEQHFGIFPGCGKTLPFVEGNMKPLNESSSTGQSSCC